MKFSLGQDAGIWSLTFSEELSCFILYLYLNIDSLRYPRNIELINGNLISKDD